MQLDEAERGFSFQADGPLDMRMGGDGRTAPPTSSTRPSEERTRRHPLPSRRGAPLARHRPRHRQARAPRRADHAHARAGRSRRRASSAAGAATTDHPATRTFQALRIYVNDELGELARGAGRRRALLKPGGRLVVVTFHSLEDRIVKRFLAERAGKQAARLAPSAAAIARIAAASFRIVNPKPLTPQKGELDANPRAGRHGCGRPSAPRRRPGRSTWSALGVPARPGVTSRSARRRSARMPRLLACRCPSLLAIAAPSCSTASSTTRAPRGAGAGRRARHRAGQVRHRRAEGRARASGRARAHRAAGARSSASARHRRAAVRARRRRHRRAARPTAPDRLRAARPAAGGRPIERPRQARRGAPARGLLVLGAASLPSWRRRRSSCGSPSRGQARSSVAISRAAAAQLRPPRHRRPQRPAARHRPRGALAVRRSGAGARPRRGGREAARPCCPISTRPSCARLLGTAAGASCGCGAACRPASRSACTISACRASPSAREQSAPIRGPPRRPRARRRQYRQHAASPASSATSTRRSASRRCWRPRARSGAPVRLTHRSRRAASRSRRSWRAAMRRYRARGAAGVRPGRRRRARSLAAASLPDVDPARPAEALDAEPHRPLAGRHLRARLDLQAADRGDGARARPGHARHAARRARAAAGRPLHDQGPASRRPAADAARGVRAFLQRRRRA